MSLGVLITEARPCCNFTPAWHAGQESISLACSRGLSARASSWLVHHPESGATYREWPPADPPRCGPPPEWSNQEYRTARWRLEPVPSWRAGASPPGTYRAG